MSRPQEGDLNSSPSSSRASSLRRSRRNESPINVFPVTKAPARRTRSSLALSTANTSDNDDEQLVGPTSRLEVSAAVKNPRGRGRPPLKRTSEVSSVASHGDGSGYSTPATSAVATPAETGSKEIRTSVRRRGRPRLSTPNPISSSNTSAVQQAKKLRESSLSLNSSSGKRKWKPFDPADGKDKVSEYEAEDSDNTPDAQLAKALQEEDRKVNKMIIDDSAEEITPRRASRALRTFHPAPGYVSDIQDNEVDVKPSSSRYMTTHSSKRRQLGNGSRSEYRQSSIPDSQDSDGMNESDKSDTSEFDPGDAYRVVADIDDFDHTDDIPSTSILSPNKKTLQATLQQSATRRPSQLSRGMHRGRGRGRGRGRSRGATAPAARVSSTIQTASMTSLSELSESVLDTALVMDSDAESTSFEDSSDDDDDDGDGILLGGLGTDLPNHSSRRVRRAVRTVEDRSERRARQDRARLEHHHPELLTMWEDLKNAQSIKPEKAKQPTTISRELKPFQLEGLSWMKAMERTQWGGGLLGDEMGMGKTIQAVSLIMSDYPAKNPSLVLIPPVALMQWQQEIGDYTDGTLKTFVFHGQNLKSKSITVDELKKYDVILMSYNSLESMYRHQEKGFRRKNAMHFEKSVIHQIKFHRVILDEAHNIKQRTTGVAKACFALKASHKWCLSGTPLQNRIGEFFSLVRFLNIRPFACYFCKQCPCSTLEWSMNSENRCTECDHSAMQHVSVFNQELLNPIQKHGSRGPGKAAFEKLRLLTDRFMLRRVKRDHSSAMELPTKEIYVDRQFFGEEENDFAGSIMNNGTRKFETYVAQGVLLNNYANIFGLIMQMRQVADHPDLILKKNGEGGQNILVCCICDEVAEDAIRSSCKHDFCRQCVKSYLTSSDEIGSDRDCPRCHIPLSIDLEQPEIEQDEHMVKKSSIINRIKMENWTSSSKIEALVYDLYKLRSNKSSAKSIIFSQFTTMLQLVEWRLRRAGITTVMLDGSMTPSQRQASINHFMTDVNVECFLVSLKAGGVALNLTEASHVFIIDPWWNPAAEWQSADRCHRIGQCRPCSITRLCIEDSVESRMVLLQEKKANMINGTINADDAAMESLTPEDMSFLFRGT